MNGPRRSGPPPTEDPAGADRPWRPSIGLLAIAVALVAGALVYGWLSMPGPQPAARDIAPPPTFAAASNTPAEPAAPLRAAPLVHTAAATASAPVAAPRHIQRQRDPNGDQTPDLADYINDGEKPTMADVIQRLHAAGVYTGLGAFQPPGTRPPLVGLAVPEGFELPPGYVRHYQATDDGQRIEPILMFSPDYQFHDAAGRPVAIPKDRVVPPELAPPGMPIRRITIPAPVDEGGPGS
jgi:hypothetical protein